MNGYSGTITPGGMYVKALYDYDADDRTSLSFRQGDIIQVITQLESGWWDGVINGVRGWFPSNYCTVVQRPSEQLDDDRDRDRDRDRVDAPDDHDTQSLGGTDYTNSDNESISANDTILPIERHQDRGHGSSKEEEAAFWIPQATPDGRLFYFNTLTGVSTMELPLESPQANESGPRDRTNVFVPESSRPPAELLASGTMYDTDDDTSASDAEGPGNKSSYGRKRFSDGLSSATSMESMNQGLAPRSYDMNGTSFSGASMQPNGTTATSFNSPTSGDPSMSAQSRKFYDEVNPVPLTWNRMVEDMRRAIERYRQAINNSNRSEFVKRAEDISDHLRLLLAAGSGTTDNHSGNPSIISTNKALYPHFRETMSRFSKLVLSSHIAASDFPPPDSYSKCLKEADGVLNGVYGFVEVARQQRGEDVPRLVPGFIVGSGIGGSWHNNGTDTRDNNSNSLFLDDEFEGSVEPTVKLDSRVLERLEDIKRLIVSSVRRLDEHCVVREKIVSRQKHQLIGDHICTAGGKVLEVCRPWLSTVESINLSSIGTTMQDQQLSEFSMQKQRVYDVVSELVIACQGVAAPLGDEWAELHGDSLEDRINNVRTVSRDLEATIAQQYGLLQNLSEAVPLSDIAIRTDSRRFTDTDSELANSHGRGPSGTLRPLLKDLPQSKTYSEGTALDKELDGPIQPPRNNKKLKDFFGEVPVIPQSAMEETPEYLRLDHEGEISYDHKVTPPQLRGGTLAGLVEQLTRHDRLDPAFNNTFLLTYRSFTTASELFEMLVKRWGIQPPPGIANDNYQTWVDQKQKPIRFRVVNILKSWFDNYWMEGNDEEARILIQRVYNFAKDHVATTSTPGAAPLMTSVEQRSRGPDMPTKRLVLTLSAQTPQPILPKHMKKLKFLDIDATEFARQLTIIESKLYGKIRPTECLNKTWQKKLQPGEPDPAANVKALILHSNQLTNWVAQMILTQQDVKRRVIVIKHFVNVADVSVIIGLGAFSQLTNSRNVGRSTTFPH
jgi:son of sevenless-like protein